jgi:hypothetical protein
MSDQSLNLQTKLVSFVPELALNRMVPSSGGVLIITIAWVSIVLTSSVSFRVTV